MSALLLAIVVAQSPQQHLVFRNARHWLIVDQEGKLVRALETFPEGIPQDVRDVAASSDGNQLAVTAWLPSASNVMLFLWDARSGAAHQIGELQGFHAAPSFSRDGRKLIFAHHPKKGGPPGAHQPGAWAQLYEQDLDTLELKQLTADPGCHMESTSFGGRLYFAHANCHGGRRLEVLNHDRVIEPLTTFEDVHGEPSLSLDGRKLVFTVDRGDEIELAELAFSVKGAKPKRLWRGAREGRRFRPQYLRDGSVMFQNGAKVMLLRNGVAQPWSDSGGVR